MFKPVVRLLFCIIISLLIGCQQEKVSPQFQKKYIDSLRDTAKHFQETGNKAQALSYHYKVHALAKKSGQKEHQARSLVDIAAIIREDSSNKSLEHLYDALDIAREIRHDKLRSDIYLAISETYKRQQNFRQALLALEDHRQLVDSLILRDNERAMAQKKSQQDVERTRLIATSIILSILAVGVVLAFYYSRMRKLNAKLKELNGLKDQLFSVIGHDLRGPAGSQVQALELLAEGTIPEEEKKEMAIALLRQSRAFYDTIENLFRWANSQQHGISMLPEQFDPVLTIDQNLGLLEGQASKKKIGLSRRGLQHVPIFCDKDHFDFVVRNLVSNAIKFSDPEGSVVVTVEMSPGFALFTVSDKGVGMSPAQLKMMSSTSISSTYGTAGEKGTGLGLQLSKRMIIANHGKLWIESEQGKGTRVLFSLPLANESTGQ